MVTVVRNLLPSLWRRGYAPGRSAVDYPFGSLQREMNQLFDDFFTRDFRFPFGAPAERTGAFYPSVDVKEDDKEITFKAELPGVDEKDVEVTLKDDSLIIKGEKKEEKEEEGKNYYTMERTYGAFHRVLPLPSAVNAEKVEANFKKGILTVKLNKIEATAKERKISIKTE